MLAWARTGRGATGAPFLWLLLAAGPVAAGCPPPAIAERVVAGHVYDGDTLRLRDGRKVRLVGIDTPEIGRDGAPSQPMAEAARATLLRLAPSGAPLDLAFDERRTDRYGRLLGHLLLADGVNLQVELLEAGLATALVVPPRSYGIRCYGAAEDRARSAGRGIWSLPGYRTVAAADLPRESRGFRIVSGTVRRVGTSRSAIWLDLTHRFSLRIPRADLEHFSDLDPRDLVGRRVEGRGWLYQRKGRLRMTIRHPAALEVAR